MLYDCNFENQIQELQSNNSKIGIIFNEKTKERSVSF